MSYFEIGVCLVGGFFAGVINTLAGSGSVLTLAILTEFLGLPGAIANGTNRIGIAMQSVASSFTFQRAKLVEGKEQKRPLILLVSGALIGVGLALNVSNDQFMFVFRYMVVALFLILLIKPKRWIHPDPSKPKWPPLVLDISFFLLGIYGGFIQMGMGVFFLAIAVLGARLTLLKANAIKVLAIGIYTLMAIVFFALDGKIEWLYGLVIGVGQLLGGLLTARWAVRFPQINTYAYYALLLAVILSMASLFDLI